MLSVQVALPQALLPEHLLLKAALNPAGELWGLGSLPGSVHRMPRKTLRTEWMAWGGLAGWASASFLILVDSVASQVASWTDPSTLP